MTKLPLYATSAAILAVFGVGAYVFTHDSTSIGKARPIREQSGPASGSEALKNAPNGNVIAASAGTGAPLAGFHAAPLSPPVVHLPPAPGMTETEIKGRQKFWDDYYRRALAWRDDHEKAIREALTADIASTPVPLPQRPGTAAVAPGQPISVPGAAPQMQGGFPGGGMMQAGGGGIGGGYPQQPQQPGQFEPGQNSFGRVASSPQTDYLQASVTLPISPYELKAGDIIPCSTLAGVTNETGGVVKANVTRPVFDHATGLQTLIPQGSTIVGSYDPRQNYGDERIPVAFTRIIYPPPGDESLDIGAMTAGDGAGLGGWSDQVDRHIGRIVFNAVIQLALGATTSLGQQALGAGLGGNVLYSAGNQATGFSTPPKPTLVIRPGYTCALQLNKDIAFDKPWTPSAGPIVRDAE